MVVGHMRILVVIRTVGTMSAAAALMAIVDLRRPVTGTRHVRRSVDLVKIDDIHPGRTAIDDRIAIDITEQEQVVAGIARMVSGTVASGIAILIAMSAMAAETATGTTVRIVASPMPVSGLTVSAAVTVRV